MGYAFYDFGMSDPVRPNMRRGCGVECKCHKRGCTARIDRGLGYLCHSCTNYFCGEHLTAAVDAGGELVWFDCFAGRGLQCCQKCAAKAER